jgi:hypothetical protein
VKYGNAFSNDTSSARRIEDGATRDSLADDCRSAALGFMAGVAEGWDKLDLALWLTGPYAQATRHATHGERVAVAGGPSDVLDPAAVERLLTRVRGQLLASLEKASLELGTLEFADEMLERGLVRKLTDADGRDAWVPVDHPRLRLRDRLQALFAADHLNGPYSYVELFVCHRCEAVVFDAHAKRQGICGAHRLSGRAPSNGNAPLSDPYARLIGR